MMTVLSLALTVTSVPRLPFFPLTLMVPLRNSSCRAEWPWGAKLG